MAASLVFQTLTPSLPDRVSKVTTLLAVRYEPSTKTIHAVSSDGRIRVCKIMRMPSIIDARLLWVQLKGMVGHDISFIAAGGFSPDAWFYSFKG